MSNNVIQLFSRVADPAPREDFTAHEKTLLGDVAMDFRDQGVAIRLSLCPNSIIPTIKLFDYSSNELYFFVTKHKAEEGPPEYKFSSRNSAEFSINFEELLRMCRNWIERQQYFSPVSMEAYRRG